MTPEQIEAVVKAAVAGMGLPTWLWVFISIICSIVGAYCGAYLKKTSEIDATTNRFEQLQNQLEKTTKLSEDIKRSINDRGWVAQQRWTRKEEHYLEVLRSVTEYERAVAVLAIQVERMGYAEEEVLSEFADATRGIYSSYAIAQLFVHEAATAEMMKLINMTRHGTTGNRNEDLNMLEKRASMAVNVRNAIIAQARADLAALDGMSPA